MATKIDIGGELNPRTVEGIVADASTIIDRTAEKRQDEINSEMSESLEGKQDVIEDLSVIRSGAAAGSTSVQPVDIEDVAHFVDSGAIAPLVDPSDYATTTQLNQLGQEVGTNKTNITNLQQEIDAIQPIVIEGNVTNAPDEEDITTDSNDLLKFADRPTAVNQMGYVILRKNKTFAEQVTKENTIYEIRYAFDLDGEEVTIPAGCSFIDAGGYIMNGKVLFMSNADLTGLKLKNIEYVHQYSTENIGESNNSTDTNITVCSGFASNNAIVKYFNLETIDVIEDASIPNQIEEIWVGAKTICGNGHRIAYTNKAFTAIYNTNKIQNLGVSGVFDASASRHERLPQVQIRNIDNLLIDGCDFENVFFYIEYNQGAITFRNCRFKNCCIQVGAVTESYNDGESITTFDSCIFEYGEANTDNCEILHITFMGWSAATKVVNCSFINNNSQFTGHSITDMIDLYDANNVTITGCYFYTESAHGEGLINIKSHSNSESGTYQDTIGGKYGVVISNNVIDIKLPESKRFGCFWVRNLAREDSVSSDTFNLRRNTHIYGNTVTAENAQLLFVFTQNSANGLTVESNKIYCVTGCGPSALWWVELPDTIFGNKPSVVDILNNTVQSADQKFYPLYISSQFPSSAWADGWSYISVRGNIIHTRYLSANDSDTTRPVKILTLKNLSVIADNYIYCTGGLNLPMGSSDSRPYYITRGQTFFDTTLGKMIVWNGTAWVNMDGSALS